MMYRDPTMGTDRVRNVEFECAMPDGPIRNEPFSYDFDAELDYEYNGSGDYEFEAKCPKCGRVCTATVYIDLEDEAREFAREAREEAWRDER